MNDAIQKIIKNASFQMVVVIGGLAITIVNLYVATKLTPLVQDIDVLTQKVNASEVRDIEARKLTERFFVVEQQSTDTRERLIRMENKIDVILER